jgi:hypothetical protein
MPGEARWIASVMASALHAAESLFSGASPAGSQLASALAGEAEALGTDIAAKGLEPAQFFACAVPLSVRFEVPRRLADVVLAKLLGPQPADASAALTRSLSALLLAFRQAVPNVVDELELRSGPLREQWDARGPGLLTTLRHLTEIDVVAEEAEVILVQPVLGGDGVAYAPFNSLLFEALLANPIAALPEVVRLGWLWGQLHLDLPKYEDTVGRHRLAEIGPLALVPPALAAAQQVELARFDRETLALALDAWRLPQTSADVLFDWWTTYEATKPAWAVALAGLDRMLRED